MNITKEPTSHEVRELVAAFKESRRMRVAFLMNKFNKKSHLVEKILFFIEPTELLKFNKVSKNFYHKYVPAIMPSMYAVHGKVI